MLVAVFDTNILFSAIGWRGNPYECLEASRARIVTGLTCREILEELDEKLRSKLRFSYSDSAEAVADLLGFLHVIPVTGTVRVVSADPDDDKVIECALEGAASHIVSGDERHLLPMGHHGKIKIVRAADFLRELGDQQASRD
ncbi:MAG: putative toxin-antitoxin system toxin component, PIN family [Acidobacteriota bacterium]